MDIYFNEEYGKVYELNGEGVLEKYSYENDEGKVDYIFLKKKIPIEIEEKIYYDIGTPYGYGGPLVRVLPGKNSEKLKSDFQKNFKKYCKENNIVSEFIRFHPIFRNHEGYQSHMEIEKKGSTIYIDTTTQEEIDKNLYRRCKKILRDIENYNLKIKISQKENELEEFIRLYKETMEKNQAGEYYYFNDEYFHNLFKLLDRNVKVFNIYWDREVISSGILLIGEKITHAHLVGNSKKAYEIGATTYLFYKMAQWNTEKGYEKLHLGGGYGGDDTSLFNFKKAFNKNEQLEFYIGKCIHNLEVYKKLNDRYEEINEDKKYYKLDYFPLYRR